ncbi:MAG: hypothetical protein LBT97_03760 [Planctomycetota bacterium]|jgi:hypothetical protein|nr:hypothetical protein [Planctomycetota bacterium]
MIVPEMRIEFLGWGNARLSWTGDPEAVAHVFVNGAAALLSQHLLEADKSVVVGLPDPFIVEIHEIAPGVEAVPAAIALERKPVIWWSARGGAVEYRVHYRPGGGTDNVIGGVLHKADTLHYEFQGGNDLRQDGKKWGFLHVEAVSASGKASIRPEWPLFLAALPGKPTGLNITGGGGVFAFALEA